MPQRPKSAKSASGDLRAAANAFKALSDPHRLRLLALIIQASPDICVCDLNEEVPLLQPTVSHHLKVLKAAGLVTCERRGTWMYYRAAEGAFRSVRDAVAVALPRKIPL